MRAAYVLVVISCVCLAGCSAFPTPTPATTPAKDAGGGACVPLVVNATASANATLTLVTATFRNCSGATLFVSTSACDAPWTNVTIEVRHLRPGMISGGWGFLSGATPDSRGPLNVGPEGCTVEYPGIQPGAAVTTTARWNGTIVRDACSDPPATNGTFRCPNWTLAPPGLYRFEAKAWPPSGDPWEAVSATIPRQAP